MVKIKNMIDEERYVAKKTSFSPLPIVRLRLARVIGIDGGGVKTAAVLANLKGKILARVETGPSNVYKTGFEQAINNIVEALNRVSKKCQKDKIIFIYIGLAGGLERDKEKKKEIKNRLLTKPGLSWISPKNLLVETDQLIAFRSGTDEKQGVLLIAGTGSIAIGWNKKREVVVGGWEYLLGDDGSGFWIGQRALRRICRSIDELAPKTLLYHLILKELKAKDEKELMRKIYQSETTKIVASVSSLVDMAAEKGDKIAKDILFEVGNELAVRANLVIQKLNFPKKFPLVLVGSVFKSKIVLEKVKKEIKKNAPQVDFIRPKQEPVIGAVKLAIEQIKK